ncbi:geranylgeranyl pyrophosphate synthase protein [Apiospora phragmitis]|uniref:Geranylgeranyl pyrophosphate synthase protein n=1 Tax=Apiospora phragmitis TaxID=2905665 RepID=A0ABR1VBW9_9PEZI
MSSESDTTSTISLPEDTLQPIVHVNKHRNHGSTPPYMNPLPRKHPVHAPCQYISSLPSKGVRVTLIEALDQWFMVKSESLNVIKESPLRRGKPATHAVFGLAQSLNSSTYLFIQSLAEVHSHFDSSTHASFIEILQRMHVGQGYDLYWKFHLQCPSEQQYLEMVDGKTGAMFELIVTLMESKSATTRGDSFKRLTRLFGRFFQVRDDFMNLNSDLYAQGKGFCEDLDEEKLSFPLITCAKNDPEAFQQIIGIFRARNSPVTPTAKTALAREAKTYILSLLEASGAMKTTRNWLVNLESQLTVRLSCFIPFYSNLSWDGSSVRLIVGLPTCPPPLLRTHIIVIHLLEEY